MDRPMNQTTIEYLDFDVFTNVQLDAEPVAVSFDRVTWMDAEWTADPVPAVDDDGGPLLNDKGEQLYVRPGRVLLGDDNPLPEPGQRIAYVRVTSDPEIPVMTAGTVNLK